MLSTLGIFVRFQHWADLDADAWLGGYRLLDALGLASISLMVIFSLGGWFLHRFNMGLSLLLLSLAATAHTLDASPEAPWWWAGALLASLGTLADVIVLIRQTARVRLLARSLTPEACLKLEHGSRHSLRFATAGEVLWALGSGLLAAGLWCWTLQIFAGEEGLTASELDDLSESDFWAAPALLAAVLAIILLVRTVLKASARAYVGNYVWHLATGDAPVRFSWMDESPAGGDIDAVRDTGDSRCICVAELLQLMPEDADEINSSSSLPASAHCPVHGIDAINYLAPEQFANLAGSPWVWDELSELPQSFGPPGERQLIIGYAAGAFPGFPGVKTGEGRLQILEGSGIACEVGRNEKDDTAQPGSAPSAGAVDTIDLRPFGIAGQAVRYHHTRAWFIQDR